MSELLCGTSEHYVKELMMAKRVQQALLSVKAPSVPGITIAKKCIAAESIGGDFYTFSYHNFEALSPEPKIPGVIEYVDKRESYMGITIGDVAGHGVSSALVMALSSGLFNEISKTVKSPAEVLQNANEKLANYIENSQIPYVTAFYGAINLDNYSFTYAKAGHPPAVLIHQTKEVEFLDADGVFLGMFAGELYEEKTIQLKSGDRLIFYTDGITEARSKQGEWYETDRFLETILDHFSESPDQLLETVFQNVATFSDTQSTKDDQTLIIVDIE